jgi:putative ABC transport system ATP-binding protein
MDRFRGRNAGFVFQKNHLIAALTVGENLAMPFFLNHTRHDEKRIDDVLASLDMADKKHSRISELSQGQAQRVAIARAVINRPSIIFADEPTSALDDTNCNRVITLLMEAAQQNQSTLIIATHDHRLQSSIQKQIILHKA